jgi:hypothetical protein
MVRAVISEYYVGLLITLHPQYVDRLSNQVHPMIQTLLPKNDSVFQEHNAPNSPSWNPSVMI